MGRFILALDQGTTSSRAALVDAAGGIVALEGFEFPQHFPQPGWVEHDPLEIWDSQLRAIRAVVERAGVAYSEIDAIGITNQRETALIWDRSTGEPLHRAVVWQSRQTAPICEQLIENGLEDLFRSRTGLRIDPYFSGTKFRWLLDHVPGAGQRAQAGELAGGTVDSWLIYKLTGGSAHVTDFSNASRTLLYDIHRLDWDEQLLTELGIPRALLPEVRDSSGSFGETDPDLFEGFRIPICGVAGDQQSALFGQGCYRAGATKNTYGTGCFLLMNTGDEPRVSEHGLLTTLGWRVDGRVEYALEGAVFVAGAAIQWLRDQLGLFEDARETQAIAESVPDSGGVFMVPAFAGLGAPYWDSAARGALVGLTRGSGRAHVVRAALEAIAFQTCDVVNCFRADAGLELDALRVDGGATANDFLMQFQADMLGVCVHRPVQRETTVMGAAYLAGLASGFFKDRELLEAGRQIDRSFEPQMAASEREARYAAWQEAVARVRQDRAS